MTKYSEIKDQNCTPCICKSLQIRIEMLFIRESAQHPFSLHNSYDLSWIVILSGQAYDRLYYRPIKRRQGDGEAKRVVFYRRIFEY